jgi:hypothetical protein
MHQSTLPGGKNGPKSTSQDPVTNKAPSIPQSRSRRKKNPRQDDTDYDDIDTTEEATEYLSAEFPTLDHKNYDVSILSGMLLHLVTDNDLATNTTAHNTIKSIALVLLNLGLETKATALSKQLSDRLSVDQPIPTLQSFEPIINSIVDRVTKNSENNLEQAKSNYNNSLTISKLCQTPSRPPQQHTKTH